MDLSFTIGIIWKKSAAALVLPAIFDNAETVIKSLTVFILSQALLI